MKLINELESNSTDIYINLKVKRQIILDHLKKKKNFVLELKNV